MIARRLALGLGAEQRLGRASGDHGVRRRIRVPLVLIAGGADAVGDLHAGALLHDMRCLVCGGVQVGRFAERDVVSHGERARADLLAGLGRGPADVSLDAAHIVSAERALDLAPDTAGWSRGRRCRSRPASESRRCRPSCRGRRRWRRSCRGRCQPSCRGQRPRSPCAGRPGSAAPRRTRTRCDSFCRGRRGDRTRRRGCRSWSRPTSFHDAWIRAAQDLPYARHWYGRPRQTSTRDRRVTRDLAL